MLVAIVAACNRVHALTPRGGQVHPTAVLGQIQPVASEARARSTASLAPCFCFVVVCRASLWSYTDFRAP